MPTPDARHRLRLCAPVDEFQPGDIVLWTPGSGYADVVRRVPMDSARFAAFAARGVQPDNLGRHLSLVRG